MSELGLLIITRTLTIPTTTARHSPWHPDGRVNPAGVADNVAIEAPPSGCLMTTTARRAGGSAKSAASGCRCPRASVTPRASPRLVVVPQVQAEQEGEESEGEENGGGCSDCKSVRDMFRSKPV